MFIVNIKYTQPLDKIDEHLTAHRDFLRRYYATGQLIMSGPKVPRNGGVLVANVSTEAELETIIAEDPFYQNNLAEYQIIEFNPVLHSVDNMRQAFIEA